MFNYYRIPKSRDCEIPGTFGRFRMTVDGYCYDRLTDRIVEPDGRFYNLDLPWHKEPIDAVKLIAVCFKGWHAPLEYVARCEVVFADGNPDNIHPVNLVWIFPPEGLEVPLYQGYYFIPSFTRYAINTDGKVISLFTGDKKVTGLATTGYRDLGLRRDDGVYHGTNLHRVMALAFIPYDREINTKIVNHKNGDRDDTDLDNLEWVTQSENVLHGHAMRDGYMGSAKNIAVRRALIKRGVNVDGIEFDHAGVEVKNIRTGDIVKYASQNQAAKAIGVSPGTISLKVSGNVVYPVIWDTYIVRRVGSEWPTWDNNSEYSQAKNKKTIAKVISTGELHVFESAKELYTTLNLSKKVVTTKLRKKDRRPIGDYIVKYESDHDEI